jgi:hypothetical protein
MITGAARGIGAGKDVAESLREYERLVAERGASAVSASERTRELARLD